MDERPQIWLRGSVLLGLSCASDGQRVTRLAASRENAGVSPA